MGRSAAAALCLFTSAHNKIRAGSLIIATSNPASDKRCALGVAEQSSTRPGLCPFLHRLGRTLLAFPLFLRAVVTRSPHLVNRQMGLITIFVRDDCVFCERVRRVLQDCARRVLEENPSGELVINEISATGAYAALCTRLTHSLTVPHVFFNLQYIGDSSMTCFLAGWACQCPAYIFIQRSHAHIK